MTFGLVTNRRFLLFLFLKLVARQIEATQNWIENLAYQMVQMPRAIQDARLGGAIALCKLQCSRTFEFCAREASQIMGGIAYTKGGQGGRVEALYRQVRGMVSSIALFPSNTPEDPTMPDVFFLAAVSRPSLVVPRRSWPTWVLGNLPRLRRPWALRCKQTNVKTCMRAAKSECMLETVY